MSISELITRARKCADFYQQRWAHRAEGKEAEACLRELAKELEDATKEIQRLVKENVGLAVELQMLKDSAKDNGAAEPAP
jgi:hypothetical protein